MLRTLRRLQQEWESAPTVAGQRRDGSRDDEGDSTTLSSAKSLPCVLAHDGKLKHHLKGDWSTKNGIPTTATESDDRPELWQRECSVMPSVPRDKLLKVASDISGGEIDIASGSSDLFSSLKPDGFSIDSTGRLTGVLRPEGRNEARDPSFTWSGLCVNDDMLGDGQRSHGDRCHTH